MELRTKAGFFRPKEGLNYPVNSLLIIIYEKGNMLRGPLKFKEF